MAESKKRQLIINYTPGEECRVAVVNNGRLDEFHSERRDQVSHVGNIYVGKVTNVEPSIQAAFVDFGLEAGGFLHTTDVHPLYFPDQDDDTTERVGKKTARRDRPPIQDCLKRGQEIIVQVLKEGVGSKGPTLTSYLSIPGRYLVMMPQMDNVGVSRKVEDEETRAKMKEILDQLELPEGFGFILRTAGLDRSKSELKRDLAYLMRLQKDMERRHKAGSKPRLLYSESDLLLRCLRDMLSAETDEVVIDSDVGLSAARFMTIFAPKSETKLLHFRGKTPIYHALGVEEQIRTMYAREVPLPSGGRLVIDEAEALVAIDVNSGKSRSAGDSEENAYHTNLEAADEICRQLRLRDLGGIVINDLIDMRASKHRREVEEKFDEILKTDRARSTVLPINDFGVMSLTRQRMRGSHESIHFHDCPMCRGRGLIQRPESVAADALRDLAALLDHDKVVKAEMVVNPKVAGELLSVRRKQLSRIEAAFGKTLMVRLSDATPVDRVTFYAYDQAGNDIEIERLGRFRVTNETLVKWEAPESQEAQLDDEFIMEPEEAAPTIADDVGADEKFLMEEMPTKGDLASGENFSLSGAVGRRAKKKRGRTRGRGRDGDEGEKRPVDQKPGDRPASAQPAPRAEGGPAREGRRDGGRPAPTGATLNGVGPALGVDGQPLDPSVRAPAVETPAGESQPRADHAGGEGDDREGGRRRRRRRGGRGRGRDGGDAEGGRTDRQGQPQQADGAPRAAPAGQQRSPGHVSSGDNAAQASAGGELGSEPAAGGGEHGEGGEGGGRRRRRRRGGRGRGAGRDGEGSGGGGGGGERAAPSGGGRSGSGDSGAPKSSPPAHVEPKPTPAPAPGAPAAAPGSKPLRTLYSVFRKLKPGQLKGVKREE